MYMLEETLGKWVCGTNLSHSRQWPDLLRVRSNCI